MRLCLLLLIFIAYCKISHAQTYLEEVGGRPIRIGVYEDVEGTPYFFDNWSKGKVKLTNGEEYNSVDLKLDLLENKLLFKSAKGEVLEATRPIREFTLIPTGKDTLEKMMFRNGFSPIDGGSDKTFYHILVDGNTKLLKKMSKIIREEKAYNSAIVTKKFYDNVVYYVEKDKKLIRVRNDKKLILVALYDKKEQIDVFLDQNKLNLKNESDIIKVLNFYNTL